jgi:DNA-binding transcriptional regulator YiaG
MDYAKLIKELREVLIISQTELAEILCVSFSTVNRWENRKHEPTIQAKKKLHELFIQNNMIGDKVNDNK